MHFGLLKVLTAPVMSGTKKKNQFKSQTPPKHIGSQHELLVAILHSAEHDQRWHRSIIKGPKCLCLYYFCLHILKNDGNYHISSSRQTAA